MTHTILILQGLPASGKSTFAKQWVNEDPEHRIRINNDSIREMFGKYWLDDEEQQSKRETIVNTMFYDAIAMGIMQGFDIVLDNMNLGHKTLERVFKTIKTASWENQYKIECKTFSVPLETLIKRDANRDKSVGSEDITSLYNKYVKQYDWLKGE